MNAIFITVRSGSTRLPNKATLKINGVPTIEHLIKRVKNSKLADVIVLCTTTLPEDDILCQIAEDNNIKYYRGSVKDKLERWKGACEKFNIDFFITADGDDLFCEPTLIDLALNEPMFLIFGLRKVSTPVFSARPFLIKIILGGSLRLST